MRKPMLAVFEVPAEWSASMLADLLTGALSSQPVRVRYTAEVPEAIRRATHHPGTDKKGHPVSECAGRGCIEARR